MRDICDNDVVSAVRRRCAHDVEGTPVRLIQCRGKARGQVGRGDVVELSRSGIFQQNRRRGSVDLLFDASNQCLENFR